MGSEWRNGRTDLDLKGILFEARKMEKAILLGPMAAHIRVLLNLESLKDMEYTYGATVENTKENGEPVRCTNMEP